MESSLIGYPRLFAEKLNTNSKIRSAVDSSFSVVADMLRVSKLPFFPDYTDHGIRHLTALLDIAEKLIADRTRDVFTREDAAVLILSVLLHDLALHISEAGFASLVNPRESAGVSGAKEWAELWREFLTIARHWDDHALVNLFGADEAGAPRALIRDPFDHYDNLTESDRKLIGEFIRQHHAHLAYQFAIQGIPGKDGQLIQFEFFDPELQALAGIVARSHGFVLRDSVRLLREKQFNVLEQENVHPVFLMGILRIADFLELGRDRAPLIAFAYKEFKSPISKKEWRTNQEFRKISWANPDLESIYIPARPTDIYSFLELKRWLAAIQSELDTTWAVLGEVYGAHPRFSQFGLTIRRVRSNIIDDSQQFANSVPFVPRRVELGVAGADVLKLLIEPLYGEHPEIGIRELMQNSVDAVRERWEFIKNHPESASPSTATQEGDVVVWLDDPDENGTSILTVSDNGIGMTDDIIANYFLKAGASFRRSIAWKKEFEADTSSIGKKQFKSRVLRSGRFGIGILAAFLLGDEIEISTRHVTSDRGIRFSMRLDLRPPALELGPIQLNYVKNLPVGTTIKVKVNKVKPLRVEKTRRSTVIFDQNIFSNPGLWDWYCLESPSVVRLQGRQKKLLEQSVLVPAEEGVLSQGWHILPSSDYRTVYMKVRTASPIYSPSIICNGIKVMQMISPGLFPQSGNLPISLFPREGMFNLRRPDFSIFDPDGNLPLNLQRTGVTNTSFDFVGAAFLAQTKAILTKLLHSAPEKPELTKALFDGLWNALEFEQTIPIFFTTNGTALLTTTNLRLAAVKTCLVLNAEVLAQGWLAHLIDRYDAILVARSGQHGTSPMYSLNEIQPWIASARVITRSHKEPVIAKLRFRYKEFSVGAFHVYRSANCSSSLFDQKDLETLKEGFPRGEGEKPLRSIDDFIAAELFLKEDALSSPMAEFSVGHYWQEIIREPTIPFDRTERQTKLKHAYDNLIEYLADLPDIPRL